MSDRKFFACKFRESDRRSYTFHHDADPVLEEDVEPQKGEHWGCETRNGPGTVIILKEVAAPKFRTFPLIERIKKGNSDA